MPLSSDIPSFILTLYPLLSILIFHFEFFYKHFFPFVLENFIPLWLLRALCKNIYSTSWMANLNKNGCGAFPPLVKGLSTYIKSSFVPLSDAAEAVSGYLFMFFTCILPNLFKCFVFLIFLLSSPDYWSLEYFHHVCWLPVSFVKWASTGTFIYCKPNLHTQVN